MFNLIKYEIRKQLLSKIITIAIIVLAEMAFLIGILTANRDIIIITGGLFRIVSVIVILYIAFEPVTVFENDLGKKQGYLLFMTPNSNKRIISAKLITGVIQLSILFSLVVALYQMNDSLLSGYFGREINQLDEVFNAFGDVGFSFAEFVFTGFILLLVSIDFITLTFLVSSISNSFIPKGKVNTFLSSVLFVIIFIMEILLFGAPIALSFDAVGSPETALIILFILLSAIPSVINYYVTIIILDKKISI